MIKTEKKENPRQGLIYVKEYDVQGHETDGWMSEERYRKMYSESDLSILKKQGVHGDAIGQGRAMYSKTFDQLNLDYDNNLYALERKRGKALESYRSCAKKQGKKECESFYKSARQANRNKIDYKKEHLKILQLPIKD